MSTAKEKQQRTITREAQSQTIKTQCFKRMSEDPRDITQNMLKVSMNILLSCEIICIGSFVCSTYVATI